MMEVKVEQRHIDEGIRQRADGCAIARAIQEQYGAVAVVKQDRVYLLEGHAVPPPGEKYFDANKAGVYLLPGEAQQFVSKFDTDKSLVSPFTFLLKERVPVVSVFA